jgi:hypothetical protein
MREPVYYNKGTKYETTCDTFLAYYTYKNDEEAKAEAERLNAEKPATLWNGQPIDWTKIDHFFVNKQEEMY